MLGESFARYTVLEKLGEGGMGVVYLAEDTKLLRNVALKFLPEHAVNEADKSRFLQEARAAAALNHPNVCTIHEIDEVDGRVFIAMEYVPGQTLQHLIDSDELNQDTAVELVVQVASGLKVAHDAGIVHRDIKPANIIVTPDGQAKIMDFGLARISNLGGLTKTNTTFGTAAYMSPEQVQSSDVDHRSDIWSLGVCLYQMVTGQLPFPGENELALMYAISNLEPKALNDLCPELPPALSTTVDQMLAKNLDERYQTCEQLLADLNQNRAPQPPTRTSRRGLWLAGAFCLILLGFLGREFWPKPESDPTTWKDDAAGMVAVLPFTYNGSQENEWLEEGMMDLLTTTMDGIEGAHTVDASTVMRVAKQVGDSATRVDCYEIASRLSVGRFILGEIIEVGGHLRINAGLYETGNLEAPPVRGNADGEVSQIFEIADQLAAQLFVGFQHESDKSGALAALASTSFPVMKLYLDGLQLYRNGDWKEAKTVFTRAVEQDSLFALGWHALSWIGMGSSEARMAARKANELSDDLPLRERLLIEGFEAELTGRFDDAERIYREILQSYPQDVWALESICGLLWSTNQFRGRSMYEAIPYYHRIKELDPEAGFDFYPAYYSIDVQDQEFLAEKDFCGDGADAMCLWNILVQAYDSSSESILDEYRETFNAIAKNHGAEEKPTTYPDTPYGVLTYHGFHDDILKNFEFLRPNRAVSLKLAHMLTDPSIIPLARQKGWWRLANLSAARGQMISSEAYLDSLLTLDQALQANRPQGIPTMVMYSQAQILALPFLTVERAAQDSLRRVLEQFDPLAVPESEGWPESGYHPIIRLYLLGLLSSKLGDQAAALEYADQLYPLEPTDNTGTSAVDLALGIRARVASNEGRVSDALALMESAPRQITFGTHIESDFLDQSEERFFRGELLASLGRHEEALRWFDSTKNITTLLFNTIRFYKMAQCHQALGHREEAIENYRQFIRTWADCDPEQRHLVEDAKQRLASLDDPG